MPAVTEKQQKEEAEKKTRREQQRRMAIRRQMGVNTTEQLQTVLLRAAEEGDEGALLRLIIWRYLSADGNLYRKTRFDSVERGDKYSRIFQVT